MNLVPNASDLIASTASPQGDLLKVAQAPLTDMFTPLSAAYLKTAYFDEVGSSNGIGVQDQRLRGEGSPLEEHAANRNAFGGHTS
jgi:hypothetical protein